jgi:tetratricopeptide (TPR) repeat protein
MQRALELYRHGDFVRALEAAQRALADSPRARDPHQLVSKIYTDIGRDADGIQYFRRLAEERPGLALAWFHKGFHEFHLHRWEEALASFQRAAQFDPGDAASRLRCGILLEYMGDFDRATEAFREAYRLDPSQPEHAARLAKALRVSGKYDEAREILSAALAAGPQSADLHYASGQLLLRDGRDREAETALRRALELDAAHAQARRDLAGLLFRSGREAEARRELANAERINDYSRRRSFLLERLGVNPDHPLLPLLLGELELTERRLTQALNWFARAEALSGSSDRIRAGRAEALFASGNAAAGEAELSRVSDPEDGRVLLARAVGLAARGDAAGAVRTLERALARGPRERQFVRRASDLCARAGRAQEAEALLQQAATLPEIPIP